MQQKSRIVGWSSHISILPYPLILYPAGHFGFVPVTFLVSFPLIQTIVLFDACFVGVGVAVGVGFETAT